MNVNELLKDMNIYETLKIKLFTISFEGLFGKNRKIKRETFQGYTKEQVFNKLLALKIKNGIGVYYTKNAELTKRDGYEIISQGMFDSNNDKKQFTVVDGVVHE